MDKRDEYRVAVGTGAGLAMLGWVLPIEFPNMPTYITYPVFLMGIALLGWGLWPPLRDWARMRFAKALPVGVVPVGAESDAQSAVAATEDTLFVPLKTALRRCYEQAQETKFLGRWIDQTQETLERKEGYFWALLTSEEVPIYASTPPSSVPRLIPHGVVKRLIPMVGSSDDALVQLGDSTRPLYKHAQITEKDLRAHLSSFERLGEDAAKYLRH